MIKDVYKEYQIMKENPHMRKVLIWVAVLCFFAGVCEELHAYRKATSADAKAMAEKAAQYLTTNGKEKAFEQFGRSQGPFRTDDLYVFVLNFNGEMLAHGGNPKMVGKTDAEWTDPDGKPFVRKIIDVAKAEGNGWVEYRWTNPATKKVHQKRTYFVKTGDFIVCCGAYMD